MAKNKREEESIENLREVCVSGQLAVLKKWLNATGVDRLRHFLQYDLIGGSTPLILACKNGHLELVKFMVDRCGVSISQTGSVNFDGEDIEGAPPLWCAAAAGHLDVVRYLVNRGANINQTTRTNSTPLRAACYDGHLRVVQFLLQWGADIEIANRHGHTCLMIACYRGHTPVVRYLLLRGADVNRRSAKGNTALHDSAESGKLDIMCLLLKKGAHIRKDAYGQTPLAAAAMTGHREIVDYLSTNNVFKVEEQADALELLGATYVDKSHDHGAALRLWKKALELRKTHMVEKQRSGKLVAAYQNAMEACSMEEYNTLARDPNLIRMQALLIRERVLGPCHPETSFCIRFRGALYADGGDYERCMALWMYTLETQTSHLEALSDGTMSSFLSFVELFTFIFVKGRERLSTDKKKEEFVETVVHVLELGMEEVRRYQESPPHEGSTSVKMEEPDLKKLLVALLHVVGLIDHIPSLSPASSSPIAFRLQQVLYKLVKMQVRDSEGATLLHLACEQSTGSHLGRIRLASFPSLSVVRLLLKVGADPDARDSKCRTALHVVCDTDQIHMHLVGALLAGGAHADICDNRHINPLDRLKATERGRDVCPVANTTLKCLAARTIAHSKRVVPSLYEGQIGEDLEHFIKMH